KTVLIQDEDDVFLFSQFVKNTGAQVVFLQESPVVKMPLPTGHLISHFSFGPSIDVHFKPTIAASGGNIMSTDRVKKGSYVDSSGTSMACPHMARATALIPQANRNNANVARSLRARSSTVR
ncbi:hypothetical protein AURDEDRAFT_72156, partial [Auricularia subglabra TFB-10046 SS5]